MQTRKLLLVTLLFSSLHPYFPALALQGQGAQKGNCDLELNPEACPIDCYGEPGGEAVIDDCGVCDGENLDKDECGVCFGDDSTCEDCDGFPNGGAVIDDCGVCDGENFDMDECGVCFGDDTTCEPICTEVDISETQLLLENLALAQFKMVKKAATLLVRAGGKKTLASTAIEEAYDLSSDNSFAMEFIESVVSINCSYSHLCFDESNQESIDEYSQNSRKMRDLATALIDKAKARKKALGAKAGKEFKLQKQIDELTAEAGASLTGLPTVVYDCF